jgi:hypothetical protein
VAYLLVGAELFVIAHEVAHVALGHLEHFDGVSYDLKAELEADALAFDIVRRFFDKTMNFGVARASLCQAFFLSITLLWERGMQYALRDSGSFRSATHPNFEERLNRFVEKLDEDPSEPTPGWYIYIHNAIRFATDPVVADELQSIVDSVGGLNGLSARVLPASHAQLGHLRPPRIDQWSITVAELLSAKDSRLHRLGLWFFLVMQPESALAIYEGIMDEDAKVNGIYEEALCSISPRYKSYLPRLRERFREEDRDDALENYKLQISEYLLGEAHYQLGEDRLRKGPMDDEFFDGINAA